MLSELKDQFLLLSKDIYKFMQTWISAQNIYTYNLWKQ